MSGIITEIGLLLLVGACAFAWMKGGAAERAGASLIGGVWIASLAVQILAPKGTHELFLLMFDFALAFGLLAIAIRYTSLWIGVCILLQAVILALHSESMAGWSLNIRQYVVALNVCSILMLCPIVAATALHWTRARRAVSEPARTPAMPSAA
jgi:hypothetical protein